MLAMLKPLTQSEEVEQEEDRPQASKPSDKSTAKTEELFFQATAHNVRGPPTTSCKHSKFPTTAWSPMAFSTGSRSAKISGLGLLTMRQSATEPTFGCHLHIEPIFPSAAPVPMKERLKQLAQPPKAGLPGRYHSFCGACSPVPSCSLRWLRLDHNNGRDYRLSPSSFQLPEGLYSAGPCSPVFQSASDSSCGQACRRQRGTVRASISCNNCRKLSPLLKTLGPSPAMYLLGRRRMGPGLQQ